MDQKKKSLRNIPLQSSEEEEEQAHSIFSTLPYPYIK